MIQAALNTELISSERTYNDYDFPVQEKLSIKYLEANNMIVAKGSSTALDLLNVYTDMIENAKLHLENHQDLRCYFYYSVINASTTKLLFNLMNVLQKHAHQGKNVTIYWVTDEGDEDLMDVGLDLKGVFDLDFRITVK
ncbi:SiaC family regulatory phosphoprotein [Marinoscillum sp. MHG1-6]|uniref:SiaC family regulatory phosphoprotein n=1 Tax=Marinoscillum sp. MHG1-6 TaxID=2959627 RepID=UPI0021577C61|nr:SiaC family regulatory phosphoprotein [Marinoscillum sp. MHG1-6]